MTAPELFGPRLLPLTVHVTLPAPVAGSGAPVIVAERSAPLLIVVFWLSELLARLVSASVVDTVTVLVSVVTLVPVVLTMTVMVSIGPAVGEASVPSSVG